MLNSPISSTTLLTFSQGFSSTALAPVPTGQGGVKFGGVQAVQHAEEGAIAGGGTVSAGLGVRVTAPGAQLSLYKLICLAD